MKSLSCVLASLVLCSCAIQEPMVWRHRSGHANEMQFRIDGTVCEGAVASARVPGPSGPPAYGGLVAGLQAGARDAQNSADKTSIFRGCMADRGWLLAPK